MTNDLVAVWFRRDLRFHDHAALEAAIQSGRKILPVFIFDSNILNKLENRSDHRVAFLYNRLLQMHGELMAIGSSFFVGTGTPEEVWKQLIQVFPIKEVFVNEDFEPYGISRDLQISKLFKGNNIGFHSFTDHVIFRPGEVLKDDGKPYTVFTPFSKKWKNQLMAKTLGSHNPRPLESISFLSFSQPVPEPHEIGFQINKTAFSQPVLPESIISSYHETRDFPGKEGTSKMGVHLRFGTISVREAVRTALRLNETYLNELIWREFYIHILSHFPHVTERCFNPAYDQIPWRNDPEEFERWKQGKTGIPIVDAGMRELLATGYMHNRVRMITASFLTKNLLIDWRWGEAWFATWLMDFELASNNGGWQWAAGCGTDAAPYFRVFNPMLQTEKFDPQGIYLRKWIPEFGSSNYPKPMVDLGLSRKRCLDTYKTALASAKN